MLVDIGVNLTHDAFDRDRAQVVERALKADVSQMILTGSTVRETRAAISLASRYKGVLYATAGIHPHDTQRADPGAMDELRLLARSDPVVAVGECGLDFFRELSPRDVQIRWLDRQLELAAEIQRPVFLHERDSHAVFKEILRRHRPRLAGAVVHCFTGSRQALRDYLELDCLIGVTGWICDERRGGELRELVREIPLERLMVETDAPYLLPRDLVPRPKHHRNEPAYLAHVVGRIAHCTGKPFAEVAQATTRNARRFFGLPVEPSRTLP